MQIHDGELFLILISATNDVHRCRKRIWVNNKNVSNTVLPTSASCVPCIQPLAHRTIMPTALTLEAPSHSVIEVPCVDKNMPRMVDLKHRIVVKAEIITGIAGKPDFMQLKRSARMKHLLCHWP